MEWEWWDFMHKYMEACIIHQELGTKSKEVGQFIIIFVIDGGGGGWVWVCRWSKLHGTFFGRGGGLSPSIYSLVKGDENFGPHSPFLQFPPHPSHNKSGVWHVFLTLFLLFPLFLLLQNLINETVAFIYIICIYAYVAPSYSPAYCSKNCSVFTGAVMVL